MNRLLDHLRPCHIGSQIAVLIVASLAIANIVTAGVFLLQAPPKPPSTVGTLAGLAFTAKLLAAAPDAKIRAEVLRNARASFSELSTLDALPPPSQRQTDSRPVADLKAVLGERFAVFEIPPAEQGWRKEPRIAVRLPDGGIIAATLPPLPTQVPMLIGTVSFLAVVLTLLFLWVARALTAPLGRFADAAERFSADRSDVPLDERGPTEIRRLARALNEMRERIRTLIEDRTRMLAAIGHDLRTPITRLRLRAEEIEPLPLRGQVIRDLDTMQHMVQSALSFLREQSVAGNEPVRVDLPSVVQALCDDFADMGRKFSFQGPAHVYIDCDPDRLTRAIANLVDNGLKFGASVSVRLTEQDDDVLIDVEDDGPGISDDDKRKVIEPFYRGDAARSIGEHGSFGLGLSIARHVVETHHGRIELHDAKPHGLLVRLTIPRCRHPSRDESQGPAAA